MTPKGRDRRLETSTTRSPYMNTSRRSSLLSFLTFSRGQESIECIYCRVTTGIEWCLEDRDDWLFSHSTEGFTVDLRWTVNDIVGGVSEMNQIDTVFLTIQILLCSRTRDERWIEMLFVRLTLPIDNHRWQWNHHHYCWSMFLHSRRNPMNWFDRHSRERHEYFERSSPLNQLIGQVPHGCWMRDWMSSSLHIQKEEEDLKISRLKNYIGWCSGTTSTERDRSVMQCDVELRHCSFFDLQRCVLRVDLSSTKKTKTKHFLSF